MMIKELMSRTLVVGAVLGLAMAAVPVNDRKSWHQPYSGVVAAKMVPTPQVIFCRWWPKLICR